MPRWNFQDDKGGQVLLPTEFNHYEGALARTLGPPHARACNVLIIRETGSKMPADLGGDIYGSLPNKADITAIEGTLSAFLGAI